MPGRLRRTLTFTYKTPSIMRLTLSRVMADWLGIGMATSLRLCTYAMLSTYSNVEHNGVGLLQHAKTEAHLCISGCTGIVPKSECAGTVATALEDDRKTRHKDVHLCSW